MIRTLSRLRSGAWAFSMCVVYVTTILSSPAFAAGGQTAIIAGTVIANATKEPIARAIVSAVSPSGSYRTQTSSHGGFIILGVIVDSYTISISAPGFYTYTLQNVAVTGDQTLTLAYPLSARIDVIGRVRGRSVSDAFQPTQTVDSYTITGARLAQTTGSPADTNLNDVVLSAPGVSLSDSGLPTLRGGSQREVGYQLDGVAFDEPYQGANGSNGLFNGLGSIQVVEGAADAGQGGLGSGVINMIPKRGSNPAFGSITLQAGSPNFNNFVGGEFGFATSNNAISNYIAMTNDRFAPYYGFHSQDAGQYGNFFGISRQNDTQFTDNFVLKFGRHQNQSLQVLYSNVSQLSYGNLGGTPSGTFPTDPFALPFYPFDSLPYAAGTFQFVAPAPYTPSTNVAVTTPALSLSTQTRFLKFEYDDNIDARTYLALRYYNWERMDFQQNLDSLGPTIQGVAYWLATGGSTVGASFDLSHSFGDKLTVTLNGQYSVRHPVLDFVEPLLTLFSPLFGDFLPPAAGCPAASGLGYVSCAYGSGNILAPDGGENANNSYFQNYGLGLRFQYAISDRLHTDFGLRYEGQNQHWFNPYNPNNVVNPFDVPPALWTKNIIEPTLVSPRLAISYQIDPNDAVRASYGRSAVFQNTTTTATPFALYGNLTALAALPPNLQGAAPLLPGAPLANQCGTILNGIGGTFPCANYLQQYYWSLDRIFSPDGGGAMPAVYSNYDASYAHQFRDGLSLKVTPFYKLGVNLPTATFLTTLPGGEQVFSESSAGFNRTTGVELNITTPERQTGFSGFLAGTYENVLQSAPPLSNGEFAGVPQLTPATVALGDVYRASYIAPVSVRIGGTYLIKSGFSVTPIIQIDSGFPYNLGNTIAATLPDGTNANIPQVNFGAGVPTLLGYENVGGTHINTNYYDPAFSGTQFAPNIDATRGTPMSDNSGGITWYPNVQLNLTLQYKHGRDAIGIQLVDVFSNGYNGTTPAVNPFYQPVATGVSGPQTGQNTCLAQYGAARGCSVIPTNTYAFTNGAYLLTNGNAATPVLGSYQLAPLSPMQINLFYRRQL
jgi:hypothetical protein